ncbi:MAG: RibD family protein [Hyphomicrobiales bacterium]
MTFSITSEPFRSLGAGPIVIGQLGQSLDGRIATAAGHSRYINRSGALEHLHRLRSQVDAVIVGVGTVIADNPLLTVRRVPGPNPARIILDPHNRTPDNALCLTDDGSRRLIFASEPRSRSDGVETVRLPHGDNGFSPHAVLETLRERGMSRVLVEGGSLTLSRFLSAQALDRLHLLVAPMIIGSGLTGLTLPPIIDLASALRVSATVYPLGEGDILLDCNFGSSWEGGHE